MRMIVETTIEIDLYNLPVKDWPPAAQDLARSVLMNTTQRSYFQSLPMGERKAWLVDRMQAVQDKMSALTSLID